MTFKINWHMTAVIVFLSKYYRIDFWKIILLYFIQSLFHCKLSWFMLTLLTSYTWHLIPGYSFMGSTLHCSGEFLLRILYYYYSNSFKMTSNSEGFLPNKEDSTLDIPMYVNDLVSFLLFILINYNPQEKLFKKHLCIQNCVFPMLCPSNPTSTCFYSVASK